MHRFYERTLKWVLDHEYLMLSGNARRDRRHDLALFCRSVRLVSTTGHRPDDGHHRGRPGHLVRSDERETGPSRENRDGRSCCSSCRLIFRRRLRFGHEQCANVYQFQTERPRKRRARRRSAYHHGPAARQALENSRSEFVYHARAGHPRRWSLLKSDIPICADRSKR